MRRVLIVDDDLDILESLASVLEDSYEIGRARDGREALALLENESFDAIVLDLMMPVLDGAGLLRELAARDIRIPVILASASIDLARTARELAATDWLAKPFDLDVLERKLARVLASGGPGGGSAAGGGGGGEGGTRERSGRKDAGSWAGLAAFLSPSLRPLLA